MKNKNNKELDLACIIGFNDFWVMIFGIIIGGLLLPVLFFDFYPTENFENYAYSVFTSMIHISIFWAIDKWVVIKIRKRIREPKDYLKRILIEIIAITIITILLCNLSCYLEAGFKLDFQSYHPTIYQIYYASFTITFLILALYEAMYFYDLWKIGLLENEMLKTENTKAQLASLKNQLNPHFLFNSLNTLSSVIPEDPELAVVFVENLSSVYRYILEIKNKELIQLKDELECLKAYEFLLNIRFGDKLIVNKKIEKEYLNYYIIPMSLQILLENAVKHNVVSKTNPLVVDIRIEDEFITISNKVRLKNQVHDSTKTGLENIKKRYKLVTGRDKVLLYENGVFKIWLPLIAVDDYK